MDFSTEILLSIYPPSKLFLSRYKLHSQEFCASINERIEFIDNDFGAFLLVIYIMFCDIDTESI
jgi:hypothetical protein